ncbi:hypothetical protein CDAR_562631 [Caerostris darwini]|uniref:Uncharacterized protein n=1 Tax=Caerostris darwini TaxID=1538125 RepID=A0AAV4X5S7_9ARAC|nr:hypothetical protein CDAR_562631 [Caerostris darwini]
MQFNGDLDILVRINIECVRLPHSCHSSARKKLLLHIGAKPEDRTHAHLDAKKLAVYGCNTPATAITYCLSVRGFHHSITIGRIKRSAAFLDSPGFSRTGSSMIS